MQFFPVAYSLLLTSISNEKQSHLKSVKEYLMFPMLWIRLFLHYGKYV